MKYLILISLLFLLGCGDDSTSAVNTPIAPNNTPIYSIVGSFKANDGTMIEFRADNQYVTGTCVARYDIIKFGWSTTHKLVFTNISTDCDQSLNNLTCSYELPINSSNVQESLILTCNANILTFTRVN